ncbi:MAG: tRNA lysidine(34) synthetase TilS [Gammaproteobacteria bacterium]|nr:MAG: tRNA lysidine(34) synthetase TilS [Gammaproteobacteria bacterium]
MNACCNSESLKNIDTSFSTPTLERILTEDLGLSPGTPLKVAYSGGLDSHVLLHALCQLRLRVSWKIKAIHVDHGLQPQSPQWARHCRRICEALNVPCVVEQVRVQRHKDSLEAAARRARYESLARHVSADEVLLTAHHQDDQAETVLLQLLRGGGVHGLAAMPKITGFSQGRLARPLLGFTRQALAAYATREQLTWIEDDSNRDMRFARNYLRYRVFPIIFDRWPEASRQLARSARNTAQAAAVLDEIAHLDLKACRIETKPMLRIAALLRLSSARQRNLIRFWVREQGLGVPSETQLRRILGQLRQLPRTGQSIIRWPGAVLRRYRDKLAVMPVQADRDRNWSRAWDPSAPLEIPGTGARLRTVATVGAGLSRERLNGRSVVVRLRQGGETCRLPGRSHRHKLKKMLQEAGIPPWEREQMPLIYVEGELAAVGDRWVCEPYAAKLEEPGLVLVLDRSELEQ